MRSVCGSCGLLAWALTVLGLSRWGLELAEWLGFGWWCAVECIFCFFSFFFCTGLHGGAWWLVNAADVLVTCGLLQLCERCCLSFSVGGCTMHGD